MQHYERQGYFFNEEIINYYIDLGKKDCSIANEIQESSIKFYLIGKKELTIKQKWTVHFFYIFYMAFCKIIVSLLSLLKPQSIGSLLYILNIFFLISLPANILKFSQAFKFLAFNYIQKCWLN